MVQVIIANRADHTAYGGGQPIIHIHHVARDVHGNGIAIRVYGEIKIMAKEVVFAKELKLNTIQVLTLTPECPQLGNYYTPSKWVYHKGEYDNYASIDVFKDAAQMNDDGPYDGSIWLDFIALGE